MGREGKATPPSEWKSWYGPGSSCRPRSHLASPTSRASHAPVVGRSADDPRDRFPTTSTAHDVMFDAHDVETHERLHQSPLQNVYCLLHLQL